jgi:flagellar assembly factor FliW
LDVEENKAITFATGPLGFESMTKWVIIENGLLGWLQSIDDPELAFVVANPFEFYTDYQFEVNDQELQMLRAGNPSDLTVLSIVSVPPQVENMTINLLAPIVINHQVNTAKQVILNNNRYSVRHYLYSDLLKCTKAREELMASA